MEKVWQGFVKYRDILRGSDRRVKRNVARKEHYFSDEVKILKALLLLEFHFEDSYIRSNDAVHRVTMIYGENREKIQGRYQSANT